MILQENKIWLKWKVMKRMKWRKEKRRRCNRNIVNKKDTERKKKRTQTREERKDQRKLGERSEYD